MGTSFNPSAEGLSLTPALADLEPEKSWSAEVGSKWDLLEHARTPGINPGDPAQVLEGEQTVDGVELGVYGAASRRVTRRRRVAARAAGAPETAQTA